MDTLLVYVSFLDLHYNGIDNKCPSQAGLFSAALTAFNVQSYAMLTPTGPDPVLDALQRISEQLSGFSVNFTSVDSTTPAWQQNGSTAQSAPQRWAVWLNTLWFCSLICSLSSASVAIMVKQWLNEYKTGISGNSRKAARLRQYRLNGVIRWHVGTIIISILPTLLQISLGLFFAGLLILLWELNDQVALAASALVGVLSLFAAVTSILPIFRSDCSYQTPLSLSIFYAACPLRRGLVYSISTAADWLYSVSASHSAIQNLANRVSTKLTSIALGCPSLHATETSWVEKTLVELDADIFTMAYTTTMDLSLLSHATVCFTDMDDTHISGIFDRIDAENKQRGQSHPGSHCSSHWTLNIPQDMAFDVILAKELLSNQTRKSDLALSSYSRTSPRLDSVGSPNHCNRYLSRFLVTLQHYSSNREFRAPFDSHNPLHTVISCLYTEDVEIEDELWHSGGLTVKIDSYFMY